MKTYDLALTIVRALVIIDIVRELAGVVSGLISIPIVFWTLASHGPEVSEIASHTLTLAMWARLLFTPAFSIATSLAIWWASPRLARLVVKFAPANDAVEAR
jgi:uncharacterized membrane protein YkgB